jgi:hypothetical protein
VNLGYEGIFGPKTMFYHFSPTPGVIDGTDVSQKSVGRLVETVRVPVLNVDVGFRGMKTKFVESGTVTAILMGFLYVCWCLFGVGNWRRPSQVRNQARKRNS